MASAVALAPRARLGASVAPGRAGPGVTDFRLTARTQLVLAKVAEYPGASNRRVADLSGIRDQGQISRLMRRLEGNGLIHNTGGATAGVPNAWRLTPRGEEVLLAGAPNRDRHQTTPIAIAGPPKAVEQAKKHEQKRQKQTSTDRKGNR